MSLDITIDTTGKKRKKTDIDFADEMIKIKNSKDHWAVIDKLLERWFGDAPDEVEALQIQLEDQRETLTDKEFGTTKGGKDFERRFTLVFPIKLMLMIRSLYAIEELEFDSKFYREFAKHYPNFKVAEKV